MGASLTLAVFAALVAAITVVAAMTVVAALALLFYSSVRGDELVDEEADSDGVRLGRIGHTDPDALNEASMFGFTPAPSTWDPERPPKDWARAPKDPEGSAAAPFDASLASQDPTRIDVRNLVMFEDEAMLSNFDPSGRSPAMSDAAFGTPEWTEEEGATEIFSAHNAGDLSEFVFVDENRPNRQLARQR